MSVTDVYDVAMGMQSLGAACPRSRLASPSSLAHSVTRYYISRHVHFAADDDSVVFMDVRSDQYSMLIGDKARAFSSLLARAPQGTLRVITLDSTLPSDVQRRNSELVSELLTNRILTTESDGAPPILADIPLPEEDLLLPHHPTPQTVRIRDVFRFFVACVVSTWRLRYTTIEQTLLTVERRKLFRAANGPLDLSEARRLVGVFTRLRPLFPRNYLCLFDSLALLEFLAQHSCFPSWVFAVKIEPWAAHCWVQDGTVAFNQDTAEARTYRPVMII